MKNKFLRVVALLLLVSSLLQADPVSQTGRRDGYTIQITTNKSLVVGNNDFFVKLSRNGKVVKNAKVKLKFYMPEMPGMPYMEYKTKAKISADRYKSLINFSMGGTWQYLIKFKTDDGKVHKVRGSVNI